MNFFKGIHQISVLAYGAHVSHSPFYIVVSETPWSALSNDIGETVNNLKKSPAARRKTIMPQFKQVRVIWSVVQSTLVLELFSSLVYSASPN